MKTLKRMLFYRVNACALMMLTTSINAASTDVQGPSTSALNQELSNPVSSLWSLTFQFNNYKLANDHWNNELQFQPVLPVSLAKDFNLITRPVIPLYNIVPHETAPGEFDTSAGLTDTILLSMLSPANSGPWILGAGPTLVFPTATSEFTGQGKWQAGPGGTIGYRTDKFLVSLFPQQWWSIGGDHSRPGTSQLNLQAVAFLFFGDGWDVGYSGNILADWKAPPGGCLDRPRWPDSRQGGEAGAAPRQVPSLCTIHGGAPAGHRPGVEPPVRGHAGHPEAHQGDPLRVRRPTIVSFTSRDRAARQPAFRLLLVHRVARAPVDDPGRARQGVEV